jgi:cyclic beta-1,2-glucan synthetase
VHDSGAFHAARHGQGYSRFEHNSHGVALDLLMYVPLEDPIKISRLTIRNVSDRPRRLSITAYVEWVLGTSRAGSAPSIVTEIDTATGAMFAHNRWNTAFGSRVAFADLAGRQTSWTGDRREFLGRHGTLAEPAALMVAGALSKRVGAGLDPCGALRTSIHLAPGESVEVVCFLGETADAALARALLARYRAADLDAVFRGVIRYWDDLLGTVQVKTPDRSMDLILNRWLLYQTLACRTWARSAFYQASGAYGFRDQLQDGMALAVSSPALTREHLLRAASRQFAAGDVQHWWLPPNGQGCAHTHLGRSSLARVRDLTLRRDERRHGSARAKRSVHRRPGAATRRARRVLRAVDLRPGRVAVRTLRARARCQSRRRPARPAAHRHG